MNKEILDIEKFNIISDEENYYFFRALNMADNRDIEQGITMSSNGKIEQIRTDRERYEGKTKYTENSKLTLEEIYDHIKIHYRKDTNCISLASNANITINYGRGSYKDTYVMIKIPKKEFRKQTVEAGQYMLEELYSRIEQALEELPEKLKSKILDIFSNIDKANEIKQLEKIIIKRYTAKKEEVNPSKAHPRKGIKYSFPKSRISSYQALNEEQLLEVNKVYAKLAVLENNNILKHVIPHSSNAKLRNTIGIAFSSTEIIHYGEIKQNEIIEVQKEVIDLFALIQQIDGIDKSKVEEIKRALLDAVQKGKEIPQIPKIDFLLKDNISIEEMYELTGGTVEYGKAKSIVKNMFYLSKSRQNAIKLSEILEQVLENDSKFDDIIEYIRKNGFRIEPEIVSRKSGQGVKLSESINLNLSKDEQILADEIKQLSSEELENILKNGGFSDVQGIISKVYGNTNKKIDKSRYYAEAIISQYDWTQIGIEEFKISERNELIKRLQNKNCIDIYEKLIKLKIEPKQIPTILLNIATRQGFYEEYEKGNLEQLLNTRKDVLQNNINIELVERFLGYYDSDIPGIDIYKRKYQGKAFDKVNKIFEKDKFAQLILPTGAGKSFVALAEMQKYAIEHPNEKILYLAPQEEILNQIKSYIIKYMHGKQETVGKTEEEIIAEIFPNITFETYPGLLSKRGQEVIKEQYGMIVLDEIHRTGAKEWESKIDELLKNQNENVKILGLTATPQRDVDGRDMAEETAKKLGYTDEEIKKREYLAYNLSLENAIRLGYVVNPKLVYCKYDLILSGKLDKMRAKIEDTEDESRKAEELKKYNELRQKINRELDAEIGEEARKQLEEEARKNLDSGIGKEEILRQNVKKGGKYIVFIPVTDQGEIEDEDGNRIGTKTGEDKILEYQEYLKKVFEETDIVPQSHSLLGSYSKAKNKEELEEFESDNTDDTKFMIVMNKANEGLHIEGVDGIIWFRALDENSRILYLQQIGRVIYALDEDNPLPDDKRPVVIDLANNTLTVKIEKEFENSEPIDDLEALIIITDWINEHDGMLPNRDSSNKQEQHYYAVLRKIQSKYSKYLDGFDEYPQLDDEEKNRIQEIINLASEIDLWDIDFPPITKTRGSKYEFNPFEVEGVLKDYIELDNEINESEKESALEIFVRVCEALDKQGVELNEITYSRQENGKTVQKTLEDIQKEYYDIVDIDKVMEETGVTLDYPFGSQRRYAVRLLAKSRKGALDIKTKESLKRLIELGVVSLKKESVMAIFVKVCEALDKQRVKLDEITYMRQENGKIIYKTLADIKEECHIDMDKVMEETGVTLDYPIGSKRSYAVSLLPKFRKDTLDIRTKESLKRLMELGVISLKKEGVMEIFVRVCEALDKQGVELNEITYSRKEKGKIIYRTLEDIKEECHIDMDKVMEETGVTLDYPIGSQRSYAVSLLAKSRKGTLDIRTEELLKRLIELGVISIEKESAMEILVRVCEALAKQKFPFDKFKYRKHEKGKIIYKTLADIKEKCHIDMDKVMEETGVTLDYPIGSQKYYAIKLAKYSKGTLDIRTKESLERLIELGVIGIEKESAMEILVKVCEALNKQGVKLNEIAYTRQENGEKIHKTLADIKEECHIDMDKVMEETGVTLDYPIGSQKYYAKRLLVRASKGTLDAKNIKLLERLIKLGVIKDKKNNLEQFRKKRDDAREKNKKVKELEERTKKQLKKRGKAHEEQ